jgi:hypothetical protein
MAKQSPAQKKQAKPSYPLTITLDEQELVDAANSGMSSQVLHFIRERYKPISYTFNKDGQISASMHFGHMNP